MRIEFPSDVFLGRLYDLTILFAERRVGSETKIFYVLKAELASTLQKVESIANSHAADLRRYFALHARLSPKRRTSFDGSESSGSVPLLLCLLSASHTCSRYSTPAKRRKISISNPSTPSDGASQILSSPYANHMSPSPTASLSTVPAQGESPGVTVAMLRALTRDVTAKYGGSPLAKG